jgi:hypothetical protein
VEKDDLINLHARGIPSGDAIIRDDGEVIIRNRWIHIDRAVRYPESYRGSRGIPQSRWHNPFKEGRDGTREEVIAKFEYLHFRFHPSQSPMGSSAQSPQHSEVYFPQGSNCAPTVHFDARKVLWKQLTKLTIENLYQWKPGNYSLKTTRSIARRTAFAKSATSTASPTWNMSKPSSSSRLGRQQQGAWRSFA